MLVVHATLNNGCLSALSKDAVNGIQWRQRETASPSSIVAKIDGNMAAATKKRNQSFWISGYGFWGAHPRFQESSTPLGQTETVHILLTNGADANVQSHDGNTALIVAAEQGHADIVRLLLTKPVDPNVKNNSGDKALNKAAYSNHTEIVGLLLTNRADPNVRNDQNCTALMMAAQNGHAAAVGFLLANRADRDMRNNQGRTALMLAAEKGHDAVVNRLLHSHAENFSHYSDVPRALVGDEVSDTMIREEDGV